MEGAFDAHVDAGSAHPNLQVDVRWDGVRRKALGLDGIDRNLGAEPVAVKAIASQPVGW